MKIPENLNKRNRAFSLVEVQIALFITVVVFVAAFSLYIFYNKTFVIGNAFLDVYANSRIAVALMSRDIRCAAQVDASCTDPNTYVTYTTGDQVIVLKVPSIDSSGNVIGSEYDEIIYLVQDRDLYRIVLPNTTGPAPTSRIYENRVIARYCDQLTLSSGGHPLSYYNSSELPTLNTIALRLPINQTIIDLSGAGTMTPQITPTMLVKLRNK
ncbi:MAG: hypothetical protein V1927_06800 [Candidatus Omnitrophota bacterium]